MCSSDLEASGSEIFKEDWLQFSDEEPEFGDYYIAVDLAGFADVESLSKSKTKKLDQTAITKIGRASCRERV